MQIVRTLTILILLISSTTHAHSWFGGTHVDKSEPPTGWTDLWFSKMTPGNCQNKAYAYCARLKRKGYSCEVLVVELHCNHEFHAIVKTCDKNTGKCIYVDTTSGQVYFKQNYDCGTVIAEVAYHKLKPSTTIEKET